MDSLLSFEHSHPLTNLQMFMDQVNTVFIAVNVGSSSVFKLHGIFLSFTRVLYIAADK